MQFAEAKSTEVVLNEIVARVRKFTNADGAAVAMRDGEFVVTRATTGGLAPDVGARMSIDGSFTGLALVQRRLLHCEDSDADSRVDPVLCRQLGIRSFVVVPIEGTKEAQGVLAAFASTPHGFTRTDIAVVKTAADQIRQALANHAAPATDALPSAKEAEQQKSAPKLTPEPPLPPLKQATVVDFDLSDTTIAAPAVQPVAPAKVEPRKITPILPPRVAVRPVVEPAPKPKELVLVSLAEAIETPKPAAPATPQPPNEQLPEGFREQYLEWRGFAAEPERPARSSQKLLWIVAACVVALLLAAVIVRGRLISQQNAKAASADISKTREAEPAAQAPQPTATTPVAVPVSAPAPKPRATAPPVERASAAATVAPEKQPALMVDSASPKPHTAPVIPDADAPQISIASSSNAVLPDVKPATPGAPPPVKVSNLEPSELTHKVVPMFPRFTNAPPGTQTVVLRARVLPDGSVGDVQLVQGRPEFGESAKAAVKQWKYKPAQMNGKPVESSVTVTLNFKR